MYIFFFGFFCWINVTFSLFLSSAKTPYCLWGQKPIIAERLWCHWGQQTIWYQWSDQHASLYEKHDETTWYCNTNRSCKNKSGKMGIEFLWKIKRSDKTPWIPWKYEVNTLKCILPLSWCIQMGSDNIESRATTTTTPKPIMERFLHRLLN